MQADYARGHELSCLSKAVAFFETVVKLYQVRILSTAASIRRSPTAPFADAPHIRVARASRHHAQYQQDLHPQPDHVCAPVDRGRQAGVRLQRQLAQRGLLVLQP
jgi:hypothetical protein